VSTDPRRNKRSIIERLKYGHDKKTTAQLRTEQGCFCFQGVIADEYLRDTGGEWIGGIGIQVNPDSRMRTAYIPKEVMEWSGFSETELSRYTSLNDDVILGLTLAQLGRIIDNDVSWGV